MKNKIKKYISPCMLLSGSFFFIPTFLSMSNYLIFEFIVCLFVTISSIIYHTHYLNTKGKPKTYLRRIDIFISSVACIVFIQNGYIYIIPMMFASCVPLLYALMYLYMFLFIKKSNFISKKLLKQYSIDSFIGSAGIHSLLHMCAICAYCSLIFYKVKKIYVISTLLSTIFGIFFSFVLVYLNCFNNYF